MKYQILTIACYLASILIIGGCTATKKENDPNLKLFYNQPAKSWQEQALPLGNGYTGVMFFGGLEKERFQITETTLWSGGPGTGEKYNFGIRKDAWKSLEEVRKLLKDNKFKEAHELANNNLTGIIHKEPDSVGWHYFGDYGAQQTMGDLYVEVEKNASIDEYRRELDISNATATVTYNDGEVNHKRRIFANYPSKVVVYEFKNDNKDGVDYQIEFKTPHKAISEMYSNDIYSFRGSVMDNDMQFEYRLKIDTDNGTVQFKDGKMIAQGCKHLVLYQAASTDYLNVYPHYKGNNYVEDNNVVFNAIKEKGVEQLYTEHVNDYQSLFFHCSENNNFVSQTQNNF